MSLNSEESGWSAEKIAGWIPASEEMVEAGRVMYRVDTTLDEPINSTILCGSCGEVTLIDGPKPSDFTCPVCKEELWEEE